MDAITHFSTRLAFETDVADVHTGGDFVIVDSRSVEAWDQGRLPDAVHLPTALIATKAAALIPLSTPVVTYCWGPGCNGATRAALEFAKLGYQVREMIGGYEYWVREGFPTITASGPVHRPADPLTVACGC